MVRGVRPWLEVCLSLYIAAVRTVASALRWRAVRHPESTAVSFDGRRTTFAELDQSSSRLAAGLVERLRVQPRDRLAILDKNSDRYLELVLAIAKAGGVMVPINWRLKSPEVAQVVNDAEPRALVLDPEFSSSAAEVQCPVLSFDELPRGDSDPGRDAEEAVTWQLYTSGTTGIPKGARLTSRNLFSMILSLGLEMPEIVEGSNLLVLSPLFHIGGVGMALLAIARGSGCVLVREVVPEQVLRTLVEEPIATGLIVPAVLLALTQLDGVEEHDFSAMRNVAYGASPISQTLLETCIRIFGCRFTQLYGLTETTGAITALRNEDHGGERLLSCGRPMFGGEVRIFDADDRELLPGEIGEIVYRGPNLMESYWRRPDETEVATRGGWFHTGDAGNADSDGFIYIRDRIKDMIVSGGENIYPAEIENLLSTHPAIADVAVIGVPDERWGETVKAIVVLSGGRSLSEAELIEWSRNRIAGYKRPRSVDFVESIPRNPGGKILKHELREPYWAGKSRRVH
jgi:long-chain acyl-CoA synthetase